MNRIKISLLALVALAMTASVQPAVAAAANDLTMLVVPARYSVLQVAFDALRRFPVVLVSYEGDAKTENPRLHAWNGEEWVRVSQEDYDQLNFLQVTPGQTVLVGDQNLLPASLSSQLSSWCARVTTIPTIDDAALINELSKILAFSPSDWKWFSERYNLTLNDANVAKEQSSWYDRKSYVDDYTRRWRARYGRGKGVTEMPEPEAAAPASQPVAEEVAPAAVEQTGVAPAAVTLAPAPAPTAAPEGWEEKAVSPESDIK